MKWALSLLLLAPHSGFANQFCDVDLVSVGVSLYQREQLEVLLVNKTNYEIHNYEVRYTFFVMPAEGSDDQSVSKIERVVAYEPEPPVAPDSRSTRIQMMDDLVDSGDQVTAFDIRLDAAYSNRQSSDVIDLLANDCEKS